MTNVRVHRWWSLAAVSIGLLVVGLDTTILNVALPDDRGVAGRGTAQLQWIVDAYVLAFAGGMLPAGLLGDRYGRRRVLLVGLGLFGVASAGCALAGSAGELIAARIVLGAAAAMIMPLSIATVPVLFGPQERPRAIVAITLAIGLGLPLGPIVGGVILDHFELERGLLDQRSDHRARPARRGRALAGNHESGGAAGGRARRRPRRRRGRGAGVRPGGGAGRRVGFPAEPWSSLPSHCCLAVAFVVRERRVPRPLVDPALFADRRFTWGTVAGVITMYALFGILFTVPQFLQVVLGHDALGTGLRVVPLMVGLAAAAPLAGVVDRRWGTKAADGGRPAAAVLRPLAISRLTSRHGRTRARGDTRRQRLRHRPRDDSRDGRRHQRGARRRTGRGRRGQHHAAPGRRRPRRRVARKPAGQRLPDRLEPAIEQLPAAAADAARGSVIGADAVAAGLGASGDALRIAAHDAFTAGLAAVGLVGAAVTVVGAVLMLVFLPARPAA